MDGAPEKDVDRAVRDVATVIEGVREVCIDVPHKKGDRQEKRVESVEETTVPWKD